MWKAKLRDFILRQLTALLVKLGWWRNALQHLQCECDHDPRFVSADILEGDWHWKPAASSADTPHGLANCLAWCRRCGAYQFNRELEAGTYQYGGWFEPRAAWWDGKDPYDSPPSLYDREQDQRNRYGLKSLAKTLVMRGS